VAERLKFAISKILPAVSSMIPRMTIRNTRHAIALPSAKYGELSMGWNGPGMFLERIRAEARIATPMVMLADRLDQQMCRHRCNQKTDQIINLSTL